MAKQIAKDFEIPAVGLYLQDLSKENNNVIAFGKETACVTLPPEVVAKVTLDDLTKARLPDYCSLIIWKSICPL